jgi:hypothetical protein
VQSEDDHEELLAAANAALSIDFTFTFCSFLNFLLLETIEYLNDIFFLAAGSACSSPFWRQVEPFFAFLTAEDVAYPSQQVKWGDFLLCQRLGLP